jgi:hypothetical protein
LRQDGVKQPRNHKLKFDLAHERYPAVFDASVFTKENTTLLKPGTDWSSLEAYYGEWLASRYDSFEMSAAMAASRVREALNVIDAAIRHIAAVDGMAADDLEKRVSTAAFGFDFSEVGNSVGDAHDRLFAAAEQAGEEHGSRLGTKMAAATNYCDLDVMAGDALTQSIIRDDKEIAEEAARVFHAFVELIERIQAKRLDLISGSKPHEKCGVAEINKSPEFMLSLKARYHGGTVAEMGVRWFGRLSKPLAELLKKLTS